MSRGGRSSPAEAAFSSIAELAQRVRLHVHLQVEVRRLLLAPDHVADQRLALLRQLERAAEELRLALGDPVLVIAPRVLEHVRLA